MIKKKIGLQPVYLKCPWLCLFLCYVPIMRHDLYTLDVHYCFCLVAKQPFECSITIINGRLSRLGFEDLYTNAVCFTSPRPRSSEERLPSSCPGQGIDWDLFVCCFIYLFIYLFIQHWNSGILNSAYVKGIFVALGSSLAYKNFNLLFSAGLLY